MHIDERCEHREKVGNKSLFPTHRRKARINIVVDCNNISWI